MIASEQEMADAFVENGLLPEKFDVKPFFDNGTTTCTDAAQRSQ